MTDPVSCGKVDSLGQVVAVVEASMVGPGEGDNKLPCILVGAHDRHTLGSEGIGADDGDQLVKQVWLGFKQLWCRLLHHSLKVLSRVSWYTIPSLGLAPNVPRFDNEWTLLL